MDGRLEQEDEGRSPLAAMRARAMLVVYVAGLVVALVMAGHDLAFAGANLAVHLSAEVTLVALMLGFIVALHRGRDQLAANGVVVITVAFQLLSLADAFGDNPAGFYSGFALWAPVFIVVAMLFATPAVAVVVTVLTIGWNGVYWLLFCQDLDPAARSAALGEVVELGAIDAILGVVGVIGMVMVRTATGRAEAELARNRRLAEELELRVLERTTALNAALAERQAVLENLTDGVLGVGADGRTIELVNRAFLALSGVVARLEGTDIAAHLSPELVGALEGAWHDGRVSVDIALTGGRVGLVVAERFHGEDGRPIGIAALVRDVTLEREVDRMKTDFISMASHELRTPMTSVLGFARIVRNKLERRVFPHVPVDDTRATAAVETIRGNVDVILSEGERLTDLINDILDISKMESGRLEYRQEPVDVAELVARSTEAVAPLFTGDAVALRVEVDDDLPLLTGDAHRLQQVLVNLLSNAQKFTDRGEVRLTARRVPEGVELAVADTGKGIAGDDLDRVFERFRQVGDPLTGKPQGTGLGLPICQGIVQAHGGRVQVQSTAGEGSRFWFVLPGSL